MRRTARRTSRRTSRRVSRRQNATYSDPEPAQQAPAPEAPPAPPPEPAAAVEEDKYAKLKEAKELLDAGILTEEEFAAEKAKILG
jgi:hypothetical protein